MLAALVLKELWSSLGMLLGIALGILVVSLIASVTMSFLLHGRPRGKQ